MQDLLPLTLSVKSSNLRLDNGSDAEDLKIRKAVLARDDKRCRFCGFRSSKWQEIHHLDADHANWAGSNLVTACTFCHMAHHLALVGRNGEAVLAWIPELTQSEVFHFVRTALVATRFAQDSGNHPGAAVRVEIARMAATSIGILAEMLATRVDEAEKAIGTSDPQCLGQALFNAPPALYSRRGGYLSGIRLVPLGKRMQSGINVMDDMVASWMDPGEEYSRLGPATWAAVAERMGRVS